MKKSKFVATIMTAAMVCGMLPGLVSQADDTLRIDITIEPGFLSEAFEAEYDYYYFRDRDNPEGLPKTTDDVDANITVTAGGNVIPCNMIYCFNLHDDGGHKMFSISYIPTDRNYYEYGDSLIVTVNGLQLPLYSEPYEYHLSYVYQKSEDCVVSFGYNGTFSIDLCSTLIDGIDMYRLYNPNSGEHFYTGDPAERDHLISLGWDYEGVGWTAPYSGSAVYRLYNSNAGEHHYTTSVAERDSLIAAGWTYESIGWCSDDYHLIPLYRQYNPNEFANNHNYTTSLDENNWLVSLGWRAEDIGWYGVG